MSYDMALEPILDASLTIQLHMALAFIALISGPAVLWRSRRDRIHKSFGYIWVTGMGGAALSGLLIPSHFSPIWFGPIHLFSVYALYGIWVAMRAIYRRDIRTHETVMRNMYVRGLCLAGAFNFLPGRTTARALIPDAQWLGYVVIGGVLIWAFLPLIRARSATAA